MRMLFIIAVLAGILPASAKIPPSAGLSSIVYQGKQIPLGEKAIYVNTKLAKEKLGKYSFSRLQDAVRFAKDGTEQAPTTIYLEPDVYWTDDPRDANTANKLIGLVIPQAYVTLIGLAENADHTVIAGDRGQMAGAIGNWNTIGVGDGFRAYNITFGNYCNVDLVYAPDPRKNHVRRQKNITQAQVITKAHGGQMDKWVYKNCKFISYLNVFSRTDEPHRSYYADCFFQCTDDAIGTGDISVYENCRFKLYSSYPAGGASHIIQAYLGCRFEAVLPYPEEHSAIYFSKAKRPFAVVDGEFSGNLKRLEWTDNPPEESRHYVYHNTLHGKPVDINASRPELSVRLNPESLKAFKVNKEYNIYNLLRGDDDWDPAGQKKRLAGYADLPYQLKLSADKKQIRTGGEDQALISYMLYPERVRSKVPLHWSVSDTSLLTLRNNTDGTISVVGKNNGDQTRKAYVKAETQSGIQALLYIDVFAVPHSAPAFSKRPGIREPQNGKLELDYQLELNGKEDHSQVEWYRSRSADGHDSIKVAVSRLSKPLKQYPLSTGDIGYYLIAKVHAKHASSNSGSPVQVVSRKIKEQDVPTTSITTDFINIPTQRSSEIREGFWTLDTYRPEDLSAEFVWEPDAGEGWTYGAGHEATSGQYGLETAGRGARLLYAQAGKYGDMSLVLELSPNKSGGQGFGSATGQYVDIYTKFDAKTLSGYGIRIQRTPEHGNAVMSTLYRFDKGKGIPISKSVYSSAFLAGCKVELKVAGSLMTAKVSTSTPQHQSQKNAGLSHEVNLSAAIESSSFGGFGIQHTGSASISRARNRLMLHRIHVEYPASANGLTTIQYKGKTIRLNEKALYVNPGLKKVNPGKYTFTTLQDAVAYAGNGTQAAPTIIYLEPDVYWTDNPAADNKENNLIGLKIPQDYITLIGLSSNPDHTVIAGDRGQMAGSIGNWNTLGIGHGFQAYNVTFGNYCNVDLEYTRDPSKNHPKRQKTVTQAQVITKAHSGEMDEWLFENCKFISYLNVFARSNEPHRAYYKECFFQCTDDAIGTGDINVFEKCDFRLYSNHPSGSASNIMQMYLGCNFESVLRDPGADATIFFAKKNNVFALLDCKFTGNVSRLEWTDIPADDARHYVYNNFLNGKPAMVSTSKPELSVHLTEQTVKAFKVAGEYNIYNLLRGDNDWDPAGQKNRLGKYGDLPFRLKLEANSTTIRPEKERSLIVSYTIYPNRVRAVAPVRWKSSNEDILTIVENKDQTITVTGRNSTDQTRSAFIHAETPTGIEARIYIQVLAVPLPAPKLASGLSISTPRNGQLNVAYTLDLGSVDQSAVDWYRTASPNGHDTIKVAISRKNEPFKTYTLSTGDIGYYLTAKVTPRYKGSISGEPVYTISRKIEIRDVTTRSITTDFLNMPTQRSTKVREGFWTLDTHRPVDLSRDFEWEPGEGEGWTYGLGHGGTSDRYGLMTTGRGARLLYAKAGQFKDMVMHVNLSPHKASGQGFGSATGQYADIYIKFDAKTLTGYGLRIQRTPLHGNGVRFMLYRFDGGIGKPISQPIESSAFSPGCSVELRLKGNVLTAHVKTSSPQQKSQKDSGLVHEVNLSANVEANDYGGFGIQHTGSVSSGGNRLMLEKISVDYAE